MQTFWWNDCQENKKLPLASRGFNLKIINSINEVGVTNVLFMGLEEGQRLLEESMIANYSHSHKLGKMTGDYTQRAMQ